MPNYCFRLIADGEAVQETYHALDDDMGAFRIAETMAADFDVEISEGQRFLARIHRRSNHAAAED